MIQMSSIAEMVLLESLQASNVDSNAGLRLRRDDNGFTLNIDTPGDNDHVFWNEETPVLIIDKKLEESVGDMLVDIEEESDRLVIRHNASE